MTDPDVPVPELDPSDESSPLPVSACWRTMPELLESMFEALCLPWAREFIFESNSVTDAQILLSPLQMNHSLSLTMGVRLEEFEPRARLGSNILLVPAFSYGNFTALYVIEDHAAENLPQRFWNSFIPYPRRFVRAIRNDMTGAFTCISQQTSGGEIEVGFYSTESTIKFMRSLLRFNKEKFFQAFDISTGSLDFSLMESALTSSIITSSVSRCILCCAPLYETCSCQLHFTPARHPLNFENNAIHLLPFLGDFYNVIKSTFYTPSGKTATLMDGYSYAFSGTSFGITENLHKWAVCNLVKDQRVQPLRLCLPGVTTQVVECETLFSPGLEHVSEPPMRNNFEDQGTCQKGRKSTLQTTAEQMDFVEAPADMLQIPSSREVFVPLTSGFVGSFTELECAGMREQRLGPHSFLNTAVRPNVVISLETQEKPFAESKESQCKDDSANTVPPFVSTSTSAIHVNNVLIHRNPTHIAPAPQPTADALARSCGSEAPLSAGAAYIAKLEAEYAARLEKRKIKKREAAARSNARRRQRRLEELESRATSSKT